MIPYAQLCAALAGSAVAPVPLPSHEDPTGPILRTPEALPPPPSHGHDSDEHEHYDAGDHEHDHTVTNVSVAASAARPPVDHDSGEVEIGEVDIADEV